MDKNVAMRQFAETWISNISHMARLVLEENKDLARCCEERDFLKTYNQFLHPIPNMKMWPHTSGAVIEPPEPKVMPGRPSKCKRKATNEPRKKYGKLSKRGVKMTCSKCHQVGHNKKACQTMVGMGQPGGYTSRQPCSSHPLVFIQQSNSKQPPLFSQPSSSNQPPMFSQQSSSSQPPVFSHQGSSMCFDVSVVRREQQPAKTRGTGRGTGRGIGRGTGRGTSRSTCRALAVALVEALEVYKVSSLINQGLWEIQHQQEDKRGPKLRKSTPGAYKDAAPTNIDIGYKPRGLKWNGGDVVITSQLQRMSQSRKNKCASSAPRNA
ncbi:hypothetical protein MTR67_040133 [Solanum verrucosum]|uniref:Uncharacterized protein n=1 Tax=Solanum verrucosum TaxID=315347 RepID=A0AAF0UI28_SOLVR|nr:hypothetical protein MTR67_040133 [Solanum verrucosum]